jgi:ribose/xylose/arabinose/galactoside ABC-type transport system permease subunit
MEKRKKRAAAFNQDTFSVLIFFVLLGVVMFVFSMLNENFMTVNNLTRALKHLSITSLTALGLTFVVAVGHSDMSFHFLSCFAGMTMSFLIGKGAPPLPSILVGLMAGALVGAVNGIAVGKYRLPDMIATIAIGSVVWGMAYLYSNGNYIYKNFLTSGIIQFSDGKIFGLPYPVTYLFGFYLLAYLVLHRTRFGRGFYAVGSNRVAARFSGINVERYILIAFIICAFLASFTNMLLTSSQGNGNVKGGLVLLMPAWAAVFVGISVFKKPSVIGTFFGSFLISIMQNGFTLLNAPFYIMDLIVGTTLIGAILISKIEIKRPVKDSEVPDSMEPAVE